MAKDMHPMQAMLDGMSQHWMRERAESQMTLGKLIAALEAMNADAPVANLCAAHSYRGYYSDLAFERGEGTRPCAELLAECRAAMGQIFEGYKGGEFTMGANTPLWVSEYGRSSGDRLMSIESNGSITTAPEADDV